MIVALGGLLTGAFGGSVFSAQSLRQYSSLPISTVVPLVAAFSTAYVLDQRTELELWSRRRIELLDLSVCVSFFAVFTIALVPAAPHHNAIAVRDFAGYMGVTIISANIRSKRHSAIPATIWWLCASIIGTRPGDTGALSALLWPIADSRNPEAALVAAALFLGAIYQTVRRARSTRLSSI